MNNFGTGYVFDSRSSAEEVLSILINIASRYGEITTCDFEDLIGQASYFSTKYGLTKSEVDKACVARIRDGYVIVTPPTHELNKTDEKPEEINKRAEESNEKAEGNDEETKPTTESIFITIHINDIDVYDPNEIISDVFKRVNDIKDRSVHITIM